MLKKFYFISLFLACLSLLVSACTPQQKKAPDFSAISSISERKQTFVDYMLPFITEAQKAVLSQRHELLVMQSRLNGGAQLTEFQKRTLRTLASEYQTNQEKKTLNQTSEIELIDQLLVKVNTIPTSLVLAQAALESGWGTSRFAREGNNYFGQHCFVQGCGMVARERAPGTIDEVQVFKSPKDSVMAYFDMLNGAPAFEGFRQTRAEMVKNGQPFDANTLVMHLGDYSQLEGNQYANRIISTMKYNDFYQYDKTSS
ncbi:MAG: glucosaminidase domain-containing protein [Francisellaceae bacterium]